MSDTLHLLLDTTPPRVEFGDAGGTSPGEFFQIAYTSDEPLAVATLIDAGDQRLALDVGATTLSAVLPAGTFDGWATIEWADDVGNADRQTAVVRITSAVVAPPTDVPPKPGGPPRPDKRPIRRRLTARSRIQVRVAATTHETTRTRRRREVVTVVSRTRSRAELHREAHLTLESRATIHAGTRAEQGMAVTSETAIRRRDDPTIEAFLLDLL